MKTVLALIGLSLLNACGSDLASKLTDTGGIALDGPGSCYIETDADDSAICYTFSGIGWSTGTAESFCETKSTSGVSIEWRQNQGCPSGPDGVCAIDAIPAFEHEAYIYGDETTETGKEICSLLGGTWSE